MQHPVYYFLNKFFMNEVEVDILAHLKNDNKVIFDVGCYRGEFTKSLIKEDKKLNLISKFFLFDPNPNVKNYLKNLLTDQKVKYFNIAFDNSNLLKKFYLNKFFEPSGSSLKKITIEDKKWMVSRKMFMQIFQPFKKIKSYEEIEVQTQTLDNFCVKENINNIDLLKIDTEGNELNVLKGAKSLLSQNKISVIYVEIIESKKKYNLKEKEVVEYLNNFNFKLEKSYSIRSLSFLSGLKGTDNLFVCKNEN